MSVEEIMATLSKLSAHERAEILAQLCRMEEMAGPTDREKTLLNDAQSAYNAKPSAGSPWSDVEARLRKRP